jgi:hypothetical protein
MDSLDNFRALLDQVSHAARSQFLKGLSQEPENEQEDLMF